MRIINQACPARLGQPRLNWAYPLCWLALGAICSGQVNAADRPMGVERVARLTPVGYQTPSAGTDDAVRS